jgi:hypothetical protein
MVAHGQTMHSGPHGLDHAARFMARDDRQRDGGCDAGQQVGVAHADTDDPPSGLIESGLIKRDLLELLEAIGGTEYGRGGTHVGSPLRSGGAAGQVHLSETSPTP